MDTSKTCPKCQSKHWMTGLPLFPGSELTVYVTPPTWLEAAKGMSGVRASVCGDCGYTEFYAVNPKVVLDEWRRQNA